MNALLWIVQWVLALAFLAHGTLYLFPPAAVQEMRQALPFSAAFLNFIFTAEILAALGLTLPGLSGILPWLTPLAASGLVVIMAGAVVHHISRGETAPALITAILLALAAFVSCMRWLVIPL